MVATTDTPAPAEILPLPFLLPKRLRRPPVISFSKEDLRTGDCLFRVTFRPSASLAGKDLALIFCSSPDCQNVYEIQGPDFERVSPTTTFVCRLCSPIAKQVAGLRFQARQFDRKLRPKWIAGHKERQKRKKPPIHPLRPLDYSLVIGILAEQHPDYGDIIRARAAEYNASLTQVFNSEASLSAVRLANYSDDYAEFLEFSKYDAQLAEAWFKEQMGDDYIRPEITLNVIFETLKRTTRTGVDPNKILEQIRERMKQSTSREIRRMEIVVSMINENISSKEAAEKYGKGNKGADTMRKMKSRAIQNSLKSDDRRWEEAIEATFMKPTWRETIDKQRDGLYALVQLKNQAARLYFLIEDSKLGQAGWIDDADLDASIRRTIKRIKGNPGSLLRAFRRAMQGDGLRRLTFSGDPQYDSNRLKSTA